MRIAKHEYYFILISFFVIILIITPAVSQQNCEMMPMMNGPDAGKSVLMCPGVDGVWRPAAAPRNNSTPQNITRAPIVTTSQKEAAKYQKILETTVGRDSNSWSWNRYDHGSMSNIQVLSRNKDGSAATVKGNYTYNGGVRGWVEATLTRGTTVECLHFHDMGVCHPPRTAPPPANDRSQTVSSGGRNTDAEDAARRQDLREAEQTMRYFQQQSDNMRQCGIPNGC